jgi:hypothetical protein
MRKAIIPILVVVILGVFSILVANILSNTAIAIKNKGLVSVKGFAKQAIKSDLGIFKATIVQEDKDLKMCYEKLTGDRNKVQDFLKELRFSEEKVRFYPVQIEEKYRRDEKGYKTEEIATYRLSQNIEIENKEVEKIEALATEITEVLSKGVRMFVSQPQYIYTKLDELKIEMIGKATANAKQRAETIAKEGKFRLGAISSVRVGIFQITPLHSTEVSDYGINDTTSIEKEIKSVVEVKYFVR